MLPIGYDDFRDIIQKKLYYVDKTLLIKELLDHQETQVSLILRPRRFGKTLNLSMLQHFLAKTVLQYPTCDLFHNLNITRCGLQYMQHQGQYPVISISFKDLKQSTFKSFLEKINELIVKTFDQHHEIKNSPQLTEVQKRIFATILNGTANSSQLEYALQMLTECLHAHHGIKPWLLIDEYDTPIHAGYKHGYYEDIITFMRGLLGSVLKNNPYLERAVITGILRVSKESLFSGLNNLEVHSLFSEAYSEYFGFTPSEVDTILKTMNLSDKAPAIKAWYNGYQFGETTIYNPWSIANCIKYKGLTQSYWINTSNDEIIKELLQQSPLTFKTQFEALMQGQTTTQLIDESMVFLDLQKNPSAAWSLLLMSGYLTWVSFEPHQNFKRCQLRVPNQEVNNLYCTIIELWLAQEQGLMWYSEFIDALVQGNMEVFTRDLEKVLMHIVSVHDMAQEPEAFFHGLLLGFIASLQQTHHIQSNRESGLGRFDIVLLPKNPSALGIILELKAKKSSDSTSLDTLAMHALAQIEDKKYASVCQAHGLSRVLKIAIAFKGKRFALRFTDESCF